jgi:arylsulfatase A
MRFNHCYSQPVCCPSRVKIMTGRSNASNYVYWDVLDPQEKTFGHMMQDAGYATCVAGKWQLYGQGTFAPELKGKGTLPEDAGFDEHCLWRVESNPSRYWQPGFRINGQMTSFPDENAFGPEICTDFICDFIDKNKQKPFFAYYPMMLTHGPFVTTPDSLDKSSTASQQNFEDMVAYMDKLVGRIVDQLDEAGVLDNTLILFTGDNGSPGGKKGGIKSELNGVTVHGGKSKTTDAGTRVALVASMPGTVPRGKVTDDLVDFSDMMPTIAGMTGAKTPRGEVLDGVSFAPQLQGRIGTPREWIYLYHEPVPGPEPDPIIFTRDQRWKLYSDGRLFDISKDVLEQNPITEGGDQARKKLQAALDSMPKEGKKIYRPNNNSNMPGGAAYNAMKATST